MNRARGYRFSALEAKAARTAPGPNFSQSQIDVPRWSIWFQPAKAQT